MAAEPAEVGGQATIAAKEGMSEVGSLEAKGGGTKEGEAPEEVGKVCAGPRQPGLIKIEGGCKVSELMQFFR